MGAYSTGGEIRLGKVFGDHLIDIATRAPRFPTTIRGFLDAGADDRAIFDGIAEGDGAAIPLDSVTLHAPITDPEI